MPARAIYALYYDNCSTTVAAKTKNKQTNKKQKQMLFDLELDLVVFRFSIRRKTQFRTGCVRSNPDICRYGYGGFNCQGTTNGSEKERESPSPKQYNIISFWACLLAADCNLFAVTENRNTYKIFEAPSISKGQVTSGWVIYTGVG